jgi:cyclopropane fatty-acyl-phospholipid synthase-like methyltransferase
MNRSILKRLYWRLLRAFGFKQLSWDKQFEAGVWCNGQRSLHTIRKVKELCNGGYLVEFGAGEGTLPLALPEYSFSHYIGYDISSVAVRRARDRASEGGLIHCQFEQCDMAQWTGTSGVSLVVIEECLYYLTPREAEAFLRRCCQALLPGGSILVIVHSAAKHFRILQTCRSVCRVKDESVIGGRTFITLASN